MTGKSPGPHREKRLSAAFVSNVITPGFYGDGNGLYLKVDASGARRWVQRIVVNGKRRDIGLGSAKLISLATAREQALEHRKLARTGADPLARRRHMQAILSFEDASKKVHEFSLPTWRNKKHGKEWLDSLAAHVFPLIGSRQVNEINSADVLAVLTPIWNAKPETARRIKQRIGTVMKWAVAQGWRVDNPADAISKALPKHDRSKVQHRKALPYERVGAALTTVRHSQASTTSKLAFELLVLTATRSGETRLAEWAEFDLEKAIWTIPAARMKAKREHKIPLSTRALEVLGEAQTLRRDDCPLVFPSVTGKALSDSTLSKLLRELGIPAVPHGFRSSFRDWAGEQTHYPREVIEFALAHVIQNKAEAAYARSDLLAKRRHLMSDWNDFILAS